MQPCAFDPVGRSMIRAEIDAAVFHLFGVGRAEVDHIMETFPIVKRKDEAAFGSYRTKDLILEVYDAMQASMDSGQPYLSAFELEQP